MMLANKGKVSAPDVGVIGSQCQALCKGAVDKLMGKWRAWPESQGKERGHSYMPLDTKLKLNVICSRILLYCHLSEYVPHMIISHLEARQLSGANLSRCLKVA